MMYHAMRGLGQDPGDSGISVSTNTDISSYVQQQADQTIPGQSVIDGSGSSPASAASWWNWTTSSPMSTSSPSGNPSSGFNWGNFLSSLVTPAASLTRQAIATPGTVILPSGTVVTGSAQGTAASIPGLTSPISSLSSYMPWLIIGGGLLAVVLIAKK